MFCWKKKKQLSGQLWTLALAQSSCLTWEGMSKESSCSRLWSWSWDSARGNVVPHSYCLHGKLLSRGKSWGQDEGFGLFSQSRAKQLSLPQNSREGFPTCLYRKLMWEERGSVMVGLFQTLHHQPVLVDAERIILVSLYMSNTGGLWNRKGSAGLLCFKQIYSTSWAKEKVTAHIAMYFM